MTNPWKIVIGASVCIFIVTTLVRSVFFVRREIIDVHDTNVRMLSLITVIVIFSGMTSYHAYNAWFTFGSLGVFRLPLVFLFLFPLFCLCYSYFAIPRHFRTKYKLDPINKSRSPVSEELKDLSIRLGLESPPEVLLSGVKDISPFVFGWLKRSYLVLPYNFDAIIDMISLSKEVRASNRTFVLLHELSHVKNGDHLLVGWLASMSKSLKFWLTLLILTPLPYFFLFDVEGLQPFYLVYVFWLFCFFVSSYFLLISFLKNRELLADARSLVYGPKTSPNSLSTRLEMIEQLLISFGILSKSTIMSGTYFSLVSDRDWINKFQIRKLKLPVQSIWKRIQWLFEVHPPIARRIEYLRAGNYIYDFRKSSDIGSAFWTGITFSLALLTIFLIGTREFSLFPGLVFVLIIFHSLQLTSPLRRSVYFFSRKDFSAIMKRFLVNYLISYATSVFMLACLVFVPAMFLSKNLSPIGLSLALVSIIYLTSFFMSILIGYLARLAFRFDVLFKKEVISTSFYVCSPVLAVLAISIMILIFQQVGIKGILSGFVLSASGLLIIVVRVFKFEIGPLDAWVCYDMRLFGLELEGENFEKYGLISLFVYFVLLLLIPCITFSHIFDFVFAKLDAKYDQSQLYSSVVPLCACIYIAGFLVLAMRHSKEHPFVRLRKIWLVSEINRLLCRNIEQNTKDRCLEILKRTENTCRGTFGIPYLESLFYMIGTYDNIGNKPDDMDEVLSIIKGHEKSDGGFGIWEWSSGNLRATYFSLRALCILEKEYEILRSKHIDWIKSCQKDSGSFKGPNTSRSDLEETFYALKSLELLKGVNEIDGLSCQEWLAKLFYSGTKGFEDICFMVSCMDILHILDEEKIRAIENAHMHVMERIVDRLRIDRYPLLYFYFLSIIQSMYGNKGYKDVPVWEKVSEIVDNSKYGFEMA